MDPKYKDNNKKGRFKMKDEKNISGKPEYISADYIANMVKGIAPAIERLAAAVEGLAPEAGAPDILADLAEYKGFNWAEIGAEVKSSDKFGPTRVSYRGKIYTRRSPVNKFEPVIWFSRCSGKNGDGENKYERLIMFKDLEKFDPDPLSQKLVDIIKKKMAEKKAVPPIEEKKGFKHNAGYSEYFTKAKKAGINTEDARALAEISGIDFNVAYKNTDYGKALMVLDYTTRYFKANSNSIMANFINQLLVEIEEYQGDVERALNHLSKSLKA